MSNKLEEYVGGLRDKGIKDVNIRQILLDKGWDMESVDVALGFPVVPEPTEESMFKSQGGGIFVSLWDSFLHLLMFISLASFAAALGITLHTFVDIIFNEGGEVYYEAETLKMTTSTLIISGPLLIGLFLKTRKDTHLKPFLKNLVLRKILIYIALIYTFSHVVITLIFNLYAILDGNLGIDNVLHALVTIGINSTIFFYFLGEVRQTGLK